MDHAIVKNITDLAIYGGGPWFSEPRHVGRPNIGDRKRLLERINGVLDRKWLTNKGPLVQEFEQKIAHQLGVRNCIAICNGTVALELVIRALNLSGEVIIPSFTFIATAHALKWQEITPVFCDIDPETHTIDPGKIEELVTSQTTGIIGVHLWGNPCDIPRLREIAAQHHLKLIFDAAHAFNVSFQGRMIGNFGNAEVFSFHATKFLNSFEGGAITTNDDELAQKIQLMKNFGFAGFDNVIHIGTNGKMPEISAAMGLTGLESMEDFIEVNRRNYILYKKRLSMVPGIKVYEYNEKEQINYQYVIIEINESLFGLSRDELMILLHMENVLARRYFYPGCHLMEPYISQYSGKEQCLPMTSEVSERILVLPTGTAMEETDVKRVCELIELISDNVNDVRRYIRKKSGKIRQIEASYTERISYSNQF